MRTVAVLVVLASLVVSNAGESPISKVISLLANLNDKIQKEGDEAEITFHEKDSWCEDQGVEMDHVKQLEQSKIDALLAAVQKDIADIEAFEAKMSGKSGELTAEQQRLSDATAQRSQDRAMFLEQQKNLNEVIGALKRTIGILEREAQEGTTTLAQIQHARSLSQVFSVMVDASMFRSQDVSTLTNLLQNSGQQQNMEESDDTEGANVEQGKNRALDLLASLLEKAKASLDEANQKEIESRHTFEAIKLQIEEAVKFDNEDFQKAKAAKEQTTQDKATNEGELTHYQQLLLSDTKAAMELKQDCLKAASEYKSESADRASELGAIRQAQEALASQTEGATKITYKSASKAAFLQQDSNWKPVKLIRNLAHKDHSQPLELLASRIASVLRFSSGNNADPFQKVQGMIMDMIEKLEKEASSEATQKAYCDKEMKSTGEKKDSKDDESSRLSVRIDAYVAKSASMKEDYAELQKEIADLHQMEGEMDHMRSEEKSNFEKSKTELERGLDGVKIALKVLREYYQTTNGDNGRGVIGLLEVVESDFSKTVAEMTADETSKAMEYNTATKGLAIILKTKEVTGSHLQQEITTTDNKIAEKSSDRDGVQNEISAILEYKEHLDEMCVAKPEAYEVRKERRVQEIEGLKEALSTLSGGEEPVGLLQSNAAGKGKRFLRH